MSACPLFNKCGGCALDVCADDYRVKKLKLLKLNNPDEPIWIDGGLRRRATFSFCDGEFGFLENNTNDIVNVLNCPMLANEINEVLPGIARLALIGCGRVLITLADNGIDVNISSATKWASSELKNAVKNIGAIRVSWNDTVIFEKEKPIVKFSDKKIELPISAFLQPSKIGEEKIREIIIKNANGRVVDLFCGIGAFTYETNAVGFDICTHLNTRDLFKKPLSAGELKKFDTVIMDPPRAGAMTQSKMLAMSDVKTIIYVSCNQNTFARDCKILESGGYKIKTITPIDQFPGSMDWELVAVFVLC